MKTDKELGEIGAAAAAIKMGHATKLMEIDSRYGDTWAQDEPARTAFAAAVREEVFAGVDGIPSVDDIIDAWDRSKDLESGMEAIHNLMLAAFAKQMEQVKESSHPMALTAIQELNAANAQIEVIQAKLEASQRQSKAALDSVCQQTKDKIALQDKLAAAEKRLAEIAKLPERWRANRRKETVRGCYLELEQALKPEPTAEEIERAEFEAWWSKAETPLGNNDHVFAVWQAARAAKKVTVPRTLAEEFGYNPEVFAKFTEENAHKLP